MSIEEISPDESDYCWSNLNLNLNNSYLDPSGVKKLEIIKAYKINNKILEDSFKSKIEEFSKNGCKDLELQINIGFIVVNDCKELFEYVENGLYAKDSDNNTIGYNCMGVYLCKHLDVCLKHALAKMSSVDNYKVVVCQYITGKTTTAIPRAAVMGDFIEPTPNFTSHVSPMQPSLKDSIQTQFDRSQVYLYELDSNSCPISAPKHVLPLWVVVYGGKDAARSVEKKEKSLNTVIEEINNRGNLDFASKNTTGLINKIDEEMSYIAAPSKDLAVNLRLQRAIEQINARGVAEQPSMLQQAIDNINNKGQMSSLVDAYYEDVIEDNYQPKLNSLQSSLNTRLSSQYASSAQQLNSSNHPSASQLTPSQLSSQLAHLSNQSISADGLFPSLNFASNEALYYCSDTNSILDVNSLLALANANHNISTILPLTHSQPTDLLHSAQLQHQDLYPINYLAQSAKNMQQKSRQEILMAASTPSSSTALKRSAVDGGYNQLYDKKLRIK